MGMVVTAMGIVVAVVQLFFAALTVRCSGVFVVHAVPGLLGPETYALAFPSADALLPMICEVVGVTP